MRGDVGTGAKFVLQDDLGADGWGTNEDAFDELHTLFGLQNLMSFPKPSKLIAKLIVAACRDDKDAVVLDFFAGSGTTGDALMQFNAQDGGSRRFVLIQVDERPETDSEAAKAGYATIAELCRERLRRAGRKLVEDGGHLGHSIDTGFRSLKIDTSSFSDVLQTPDTTEQAQLALQADNVKPNRSGEDLLFQVLLDWGLDLSLPISRDEIDGSEVFAVGDDALLACFADGVKHSVVRAMAESRPLRAVFKDSGFANDASRINAEQIFREVSPETEVRAI